MLRRRDRDRRLRSEREEGAHEGRALAGFRIVVQRLAEGDAEEEDDDQQRGPDEEPSSAKTPAARRTRPALRLGAHGE